jgi:hypothetical protein
VDRAEITNALAWGIAGCALAIVAGGILPLVLVEVL